MRHVDECTYYPVPCPNRCEVGSIERGGLERHVEVCSQQVVECEFAHVGCQEVVHRKDLAGHMERRVQTHLALLSRQMVAMSVELQRKQEQIDAAADKQGQTERRLMIQMEKQLVEQQKGEKQQMKDTEQQLEKIKQELEQRLSLAEQKLKEKDGQIEQLQGELQNLKQWCSYPHKFSLCDFRGLRRRRGQREFVFTSGGNQCLLMAFFLEFTIDFCFALVRGEDSPLQASYRVTLVALDQSGNGNHIRDSKECTATGDDQFVYVYKLHYGCFQYCNFVIDDCMKIAISVV